MSSCPPSLPQLPVPGPAPARATENTGLLLFRDKNLHLVNDLQNALEAMLLRWWYPRLWKGPSLSNLLGVVVRRVEESPPAEGNGMRARAAFEPTWRLPQPGPRLRARLRRPREPPPRPCAAPAPPLPSPPHGHRRAACSRRGTLDACSGAVYPLLGTSRGTRFGSCLPQPPDAWSS